MNKFIADQAGIKESDLILDAGCSVGGGQFGLQKLLDLKSLEFHFLKKK